MIRRLTTFTAAALLSAAPLSAQEFAATPAGALIAQDESGGGRNIPNFKFDPQHTAGGHFQITDTNWRHYAPLLGIDIDPTTGYPNAMSAPEQLQGQVAGKMWAEQGFMPWSCCNKQLREHLSQQPAIVAKVVSARRRVQQDPPPVSGPVVVRQTDPFSAGSKEMGSSFLITKAEEE